MQRRHRAAERSHGRTVRYAALPAVGVPDVAETEATPQYSVPVSDPVTSPAPPRAPQSRPRRTESQVLGTPNSSYRVFERSHGNGTTTRDFVDPATGAIVESRTYDADGRVTSQTTYDPYTRKRWQIRTIDPVTGNITSIDELHPNGTVAKRTEFQTDGADNGADQRPARTRYYDANGRMYLDEVHHSGTGRVIIRYIYDQNTGKLVRTDYYDLNGTLLFSEQGGAYPQT